jgi:hypothetical protein
MSINTIFKEHHSNYSPFIPTTVPSLQLQSPHSNYSPFTTHHMFIQTYKHKKKQQAATENCMRSFVIWCIQNKIICIIKSKCIRCLWRVLWAVYYGLCIVGCVLWAVYYGLCIIGCVLWAVYYGLCIMGCVLWAVYYGLCIMGCVLWVVYYGLCILNHRDFSSENERKKQTRKICL